MVSPTNVAPTPIAIASRIVERMLQATLLAAITGKHHQGRDQEDADDTHRDGDRDGGEPGERDVERRDRDPADARTLLVEHDGDEAAVEQADDMRAPRRRARRSARGRSTSR